MRDFRHLGVRDATSGRGAPDDEPIEGGARPPATGPVTPVVAAVTPAPATPFVGAPATGLPAPVSHRARRLAWAYAAAAACLAPWTIFLAVSLPRRSLDLHYNLAWTGFDVLLLVAMARTAYLGFKMHGRVQLSATATATLLIVDAWFDITTAGDRTALLEAVLLAVLAELPMAALSLFVAYRTNRVLTERAARAGPPARVASPDGAAP